MQVSYKETIATEYKVIFDEEEVTELMKEAARLSAKCGILEMKTISNLVMNIKRAKSE